MEYTITGKTPDKLEEKLAQYRKLTALRHELTERLHKTVAAKSSVSPKIFEKVQHEYSSKLENVRNQLAPIQSDLERDQKECSEEVPRLEDEIRLLEDELAEAEFRCRVGEFDQIKLTEIQTRLNPDLAEKSEMLAHLTERLQKINFTFDEVASRPVESVSSDSGDTEEVPTTTEINASETETDASETGTDASETGTDASKTETDASETGTDASETGTDALATESDASESETDATEETPAATETKADRTADDGTSSRVTLTSKDPLEALAEKPDDKPAKESNDVPRDSGDGSGQSAKEDAAAATDEDAKEAAEDTSFENPQQWIDELGDIEEDSGPESTGAKDENPSTNPKNDKTKDDPLSALADPSGDAGKPKKTETTQATARREEISSGFPNMVIITGPSSGKKIPLLPMTMSIGREHDNNIELKDPDVGRYHARILYDRGHFVLEDLESSNGTWLNGERISEAALKNGDRIKIGETELAIDFD
jgi:hypothetical protein